MNNIVINPNLPGTHSTSSIMGIVQNFYSFALLISGILAFAVIVYGGVRYAVGQGNASSESDGKAWISGALVGLLLLAGAWIILYTINPNILSLQIPNLPQLTNVDVSGGGGSGGGGGGGNKDQCNDLQALAKKYNEPYPPQDAADLKQEINCIKTAMSGQDLGSQYTYDQSNYDCNFTRGNPICNSSCSHAVNSCHYGGHNGSNGAEAVDFGNEKVGDAIIKAAYSCGAKSARCETSGGVKVACSDGSANHVHISAGNCDAN